MPIHESELECIRKNDPSLTFLYLPSQYPALTAEDMRVFVNTIKESNNTHVKQLIFNENSIGDEGARLLSQLTSVDSLSLYDNKISDEGAKALAKMPNLETLDVSENEIGNDGFKALLSSNLETLRISDNLIDDAGAKYIFGNTNVKELIIDDNRISETLLEKVLSHIENNKKGNELRQPGLINNRKPQFFQQDNQLNEANKANLVVKVPYEDEFMAELLKLDDASRKQYWDRFIERINNMDSYDNKIK